MLGGLIRFLLPTAACATVAVAAARALHLYASAQAWLLVIVGTFAGAIHGAIWVIKYVESRSARKETR